MSFNFGTEPVQAGGIIKQAGEGQHEGRLLGLVHLGMFADTYEGQVKAPAPFVCALIELKSGDEAGGVNEDGSPIITHKTFPLKRSDRAFLTKFLKVMFTTEEFKQFNAGVLEGGFEDLIGRPLLVDMEGSKTKNDDGTPAYVNVTGMSKMPNKLASICDELVNDPIGHITLENYTEDALRAIPAFEIYSKLELADNFPGSVAEEVLFSVREKTPDFGKKSTKSDDKTGAPEAPKYQEQKRDLDEEEDFS